MAVEAKVATISIAENRIRKVLCPTRRMETYIISWHKWRTFLSRKGFINNRPLEASGHFFYFIESLVSPTCAVLREI